VNLNASANTLSYHDTTTITAIKSLAVPALCCRTIFGCN
jgi:hypothetical protein